MSNLGYPTMHNTVLVQWGFTPLIFASLWFAAFIAVFCLKLGCKLLGKKCVCLFPRVFVQH